MLSWSVADIGVVIGEKLLTYSGQIRHIHGHPLTFRVWALFAFFANK